MLTRTHITIFLSLAVATWAIALLVLRLPVTWEDSKPFALTATTLSVACIIFDKWIWKWPIFKGWLVNQPDLHGTWKVLLKSDWVNPETKQQVAPVECIMTIRQTYSRFSARLFTRESSSYLVAHKIEQHNDGVFQLFGTYQNTPDIMLRGKRSEIHYGALVLEVRGDPPKSLVGHYWTDRGTRGSVELTDRIPKILSGYQEGISRFNLPK
jgi:predicted pore-forming effector associated with SMODS systems